MLILGVDTSGKNGSIALVECQTSNCRTIDVAALEGGTFSAQLIPQISDLLRKHRFTKNQTDGLAVVSGPGSFTGLRVGLAAIKALAEILQKPIAAVSLLEVIARESELQGRVLVALDAGRGEIYCAEYDVNDESTRLVSQEVLTPHEFGARAGTLPVVSPDAKISELPDTQLVQISPPRADAVARLGFEKISRGETVSPEALDANYIRRSDAEIKNPTGSYKP
jgi:tRNA threonylcarbamoyladenosine biosynthesis protein TsaB